MRQAIWAGMIIGSVIGGWAPTWFGAEAFSLAGVVGSTIGGIVGVVSGYWLARRLL